MSFFGSKKKSSPAPAPAPRPVPQKVAATTPEPVMAAAAKEETQREMRRGATRRKTKLTGARGIREEAETRRKALLGA